jgi:hypothetical protein
MVAAWEPDRAGADLALEGVTCGQRADAPFLRLGS